MTFGGSFFLRADVVTRVSEVEAAVRDATNNDAWGPSGKQMSQLCDYSYK